MKRIAPLPKENLIAAAIEPLRRQVVALAVEFAEGLVAKVRTELASSGYDLNKAAPTPRQRVRIIGPRKASVIFSTACASRRRE